MRIESQTTVAELATQYPGTIRVFQRYGIDFCCGGKRALAEVCDTNHVNLDALRQDLEAALTARHESGVPLHRVGVRDLVAHVVERYHRPLDEELPRLSQLMQKVAAVHGERHPYLVEAAATFTAFRQDIEPHMMKEERVLFPYIGRLDGLAIVGTPLLASPFGSIESPISVMEMEHETVGQLLADLRRLTAGYTPPADACNSFRGLLHGLAELERDTHEHIHVENNILFPRAKALEAQLLKAQPSATGGLRHA
jgi:regulator of cell morphogenesis and NO signaling